MDSDSWTGLPDCNGWLGQIDPSLCLFVVAVVATAAVVDAAAAGGITVLAAAVQKNHLCGPKAVLPNFFLFFSFPPPLFSHVQAHPEPEQQQERPNKKIFF